MANDKHQAAPANAAARALGMPAVFIGISWLPEGASFAQVATSAVLSAVAAIVVVGAVHRLALMWLLRKKVLAAELARS